MASGQLPKTALAEWLETEVREGGRNDALARGVGLMAAAGTPRPAAEAAAKWWCRHRCQPPLVGPEVGWTFESIFRAEAKKRITEPDDAADARPHCPCHARVHRVGHSAAAPCAQAGLPEKGLAMYSHPAGLGRPTWR